MKTGQTTTKIEKEKKRDNGLDEEEDEEDLSFKGMSSPVKQIYNLPL